jgi:hypothetical protein
LPAPVFPAASDAASLALFGEEMYSKAMRLVKVFPYTSNVHDFSDDIYGEDMAKTFPAGLAYETNAIVEVLPEWQARLTKQGVDEDRPLRVVFCKALVLGAGKPLPDIGFHVQIEGELYKVMQANSVNYFSNADVTFEWSCLVQRRRPSSVSPLTSNQDREQEYP